MEIQEINHTETTDDGYYLDKSSGLWGIVKLEGDDKLYLKSFKDGTPEWTKDKIYAVKFKKDEAKEIMKKLDNPEEESLSEDVNDEFFDSLEVFEVYNGVPVKRLKSGTFCIKSPTNGTIRCFDADDFDQVKNYIDNYKSLESAADTIADDVPGDITQDYRYGWHSMKEGISKLELMNINKKHYADLESKLEKMSGLEKAVAQKLILPWLKGHNWMGGLSDSATDKGYEAIMKLGYDFDEIEKEEHRQWKLYESLNSSLNEALEEDELTTGISAAFMDLINQEYNLLSQYESAQVTLNDLEENRFNDVLDYIKDDINIHIGMLQASIEDINPSAEKIDDGKEEADKLILDESLFEF